MRRKLESHQALLGYSFERKILCLRKQFIDSDRGMHHHRTWTGFGCITPVERHQRM